MLSPESSDGQGPQLTRLARGSIEYGLDNGEPLPVRCDELPPALTEPAATFTTLRLDEALRGCCGMLEAELPLATNVANSAYQAAFQDPRFSPVRREELDAIRLEISVLSPMESLVVTDEADLLSVLTPGRDGLVILADGRRATFLPAVWDVLPEPQSFLAALKAKCGLPEDYWSERLGFLRYHTTSYAESHPARVQTRSA